MDAIYIGSAPDSIYDRLWQRVSNPECKFDEASKTAWRKGLTIAVSWAETDSSFEARRWEAKLLRDYKDKHGHLPCLVLEGEPVSGNNRLEGSDGKQPNSKLEWSRWVQLFPGASRVHGKLPRAESQRQFEGVPRKVGVYRFGSPDRGGVVVGY